MSVPPSVWPPSGLSRLLESGPEEAFNRLTRLGSAILGTPVVALTVVDDVRSFSLKGAPDPG